VAEIGLEGISTSPQQIFKTLSEGEAIQQLERSESLGAWVANRPISRILKNHSSQSLIHAFRVEDPSTSKSHQRSTNPN
jgi:hypothetical protein